MQYQSHHNPSSTVFLLAVHWGRKWAFWFLFGSGWTQGAFPTSTWRILQFCCSVAKLCPDPLWPRGLQHARLLCPPLSPRVCSNSCPLSQWCHPTISFSVVPFSSCLQFCPESGSFPVCWLFTSGGQGIGASASASVLPVNIQGWFLLDWLV